MSDFLGPHELNSIITGDCRELGTMVPDESVDCIFTDPPYPGEFLPLYGWLAEFGARVLKPGGFLVAYTGSYHLAEVFGQMGGKGLNWYFDIALHHNGGSAAIIRPRRMVAAVKHALMWTKGAGKIAVWNMANLYEGGGKDKRFHKWGQDVAGAHYMLSYILGDKPGPREAIVIDPFVGGGTVPAAVKVLGYKYLGFEIDEDQAVGARARLAGTHEAQQTRQLSYINDIVEQLAQA